MNSELKTLQKFHGHLGPYLVLGYKIGKYAKNNLKNISKVEVKTNLKPPASCILDGLQISTRCTLGKANIKITKSNNLKITFYKNRKRLTAEFNKETKNWIKKINTNNIQKESLKLFKAPITQLFEIKL